MENGIEFREIYDKVVNFWGASDDSISNAFIRIAITPIVFPSVVIESIGERIEESRTARIIKMKREANERQQKLEDAKLAEKERQNQIAVSAAQLLQNNFAFLEIFLSIAEKKVSVTDEYGDENWQALDEEIIIALKKLAARTSQQLIQVNTHADSFTVTELGWHVGQKLKEAFNEYHETQVSRVAHQ